MKRCPECKRDYSDETLNFCLDDGAVLLDGPASMDEPATAMLGAFRVPPSDVIVESALIPPSTAGAETPNSIAVLPFAHLSGDPEDEYFCDGLAEELLNALARIDGLKVAARTSSFSFKGKNAKLAEIARELAVAAVLEGSVRKSGDRLRITVQLINTADGYQIWSQRYDREMRDIFEIQDDITFAVIEALKVKLLGHERSTLLKKGTESSEAFELYLRGRALWNSRTHDGFRKAIENFEQAIKIDPNYALAYAALGDCHSFLAYFGAIEPADAALKARAAVDRAMALDPGFAECRTAKAAVTLIFDFDFATAEREYQAAIAINPQFLPARYLYCSALSTRGRFDEAIDEGRTAVNMDPLSPHANTQLARALCGAGRYEEAIDLIEKILQVMPDFYHLHWILGWAHGQMEQWDIAIDHHQKAASVGGPMFYSFLGHALIKGGRPDEARRLLDELNELAKHTSISPVAAAVIEGSLGNVSRGLDLLEQAWEMRIVQLIWIGVDPVFDAFRDEPRFKDLLRRMNLPG